MAHRLIDVACEAGADAVKFQTFVADRLVTADAPKASYQKVNTGRDDPQYGMLRSLELSPETHHELQAHCREAGILFLSSPFDEESADFLADIGVPALKIPSGELVNLPFLDHCARLKLPLILSTGMADLAEVAVALETIERAGAADVVLLHCLSNYPADPAETNLRAMATLEAAFDRPVGYSDHTEGIAIATAAVALGAAVVEKHFTLDRSLPGPDHAASLTPDELSAMVRAIRSVESALGDGRKRCMDSERDTRAIARKSLTAAISLAAGTVLERSHLIALRPGTGLPPADLDRVLGRRTRQDIPAGTLLAMDMLE
ncbi:N-acylneuraminate-9-phosphate synthase (plasmid) [Azospirillum lipoferum 4B]|uniref:N-acylneuraminate-9-phosphate synthase n=1 Tax=Azospirillum lipoferum (strain 4B) TaxID=862719 RepID=G7ZJ01_AZOL4|nr:N-acylneuraminate-9-phosphate synthase [Azospirillum lipoferum 4B]